MNNDFNFHIPVELIKGEDGKPQQMKLAGIASTSHKDRQDEVLIPSGFDYTYLKNSGYINWHHQLSKKPLSIIGEPTKVELQKAGLYIEGLLYKSNPLACEAFEMAEVLEKDSKKRKLGWSIEGKVIERDPTNPKRITKAKITGVALTPMPINPNTFVSIIKAMNEGEDGDVNPIEAEGTKASGGDTYVLNQNLSNGNIKVSSKGIMKITVDLGKAMTTESARAIIPESVETELKVTTDKKRMSKADTYDYLFSEHPDMTVEEARIITEHIFNKSE